MPTRTRRFTATNETFRNKFLDLPETNTPGGNRRDPRSDITAVCGNLYYMLTGHVPGQLIDGSGKQPHLRRGYSIREKIGDDNRLSQLETFLSCGFAIDIENRFQTIDEFIKRLKLVVTQQHDDAIIEDPIEVAKRESIRYRQYDRKTQLEDFSINGKKIINGIAEFISTYVGKIGRFDIDNNILDLTMLNGNRMMGGFGGLGTRGRDEIKNDLPSGIDPIPQCGILVRTYPQNSSNYRALYILVGSKGEQCVIMYIKYEKDKGKNQNQPIGHGLLTFNDMMIMENWTESLWYDGNTIPDLTEIYCVIKKWLSESMKSLTDDLVQ